jgi:hypothetical protein
MTATGQDGLRSTRSIEITYKPPGPISETPATEPPVDERPVTHPAPEPPLEEGPPSEPLPAEPPTSKVPARGPPNDQMPRAEDPGSELPGAPRASSGSFSLTSNSFDGPQADLAGNGVPDAPPPHDIQTCASMIGPVELSCEEIRYRVICLSSLGPSCEIASLLAGSASRRRDHGDHESDARGARKMKITLASNRAAVAGNLTPIAARELTLPGPSGRTIARARRRSHQREKRRRRT